VVNKYWNEHKEARAAGFYAAKKGNDHCQVVLTEGNESITFEHPYKDSLDWFVEQFGGQIYGPYMDKDYNPHPDEHLIYCWKLTGKSAIDFINMVNSANAKFFGEKVKI